MQNVTMYLDDSEGCAPTYLVISTGYAGGVNAQINIQGSLEDLAKILYSLENRIKYMRQDLAHEIDWRRRQYGEIEADSWEIDPSL